jgi:N utilization substance protein A
VLGWKIDIKSEEEKRQEVEAQMAELTSVAATPLESVEGLGESLVEKLKAAGISTVEALADMTPEQLEAIEGIGPKTVEKISVAVNNYFAALEGGEAVALPENEGEAAREPSPGSRPEPEAGAGEVNAAEGAREESDAGRQESDEVEGEGSPKPAEKEDSELG